MIVALKTVDRSPKQNFVEHTLASMFAKDLRVERYAPIRIITDGEDMSFLGPWQTDPRLLVERSGDQRPVRELMQDAPTLHARVVMADVRAMQSVPAGQAILLLEDDLEFAPRWLERTERIVERIRADIGSTRFMLVLYTPWPFTSEDRVQFEFAEREGYCACIRPTYYGSQAIYYGAEALQTVLGDMRQLGLGERRMPNDMVVRHVSQERDVPLLAAVPSLVQHLGVESTWSACDQATMHHSPTFRDEDERLAKRTVEVTAEHVAGASMADVLRSVGQ